jgi:hypothetical protein
MAISMKGRSSIRSNPPSNRAVRRTEPRTFQAKDNSTLAKVEKAYLDALAAVDAIEARKATAVSPTTASRPITSNI